MGARRRCCCGCVVFGDTFNRLASDDVGGNWNEATGDWVGDWEIIGSPEEGFLHELAHTTVFTEGTDAAVIFCTRAVTTGGEMRVMLNVMNPTEGDKYFIWVCCTDDETLDGIQVTFEVRADDWLVTIAGEAGVAFPATPSGTKFVEGTSRSAFTMIVCADRTNGMVTAYVSNSITTGPGVAWAESVAAGTGKYCAIGHDNVDTGVVFDNFYLEDLRIPTEICVPCFCQCEMHPLPKQLTLTFLAESTYEGVANRAFCLEGETITLNWEWNGALDHWIGDGAVGSDVEGISAELLCGDGDRNTFRLYMSPASLSGCFLTSFVDSTLDSECDAEGASAIILRFPYFVLSPLQTCGMCFGTGTPMECLTDPNGPNCRGLFYIEITE